MAGELKSWVALRYYGDDLTGEAVSSAAFFDSEQQAREGVADTLSHGYHAIICEVVAKCSVSAPRAVWTEAR